MRNWRRIAWSSLIVILLSLIGSGNSEAAEPADGGKGFYYEVIQPENQLDKDAGYYDLLMEPGQQQVVALDFINTGEEAVTLEIQLNGAKTNQNGVIEYGPTDLENDPSLKYAFADLVKGPAEITLPPKQTTTLNLEITMPEERYEGVIAGGIRFQVKQDTSEKTGVVQRFAYMIGMLLKESQEPLAPELQLNSVYPEMDNYRNAIYVDFSNTAATFIGGMTVDATIVSQKEPETILYEGKTSGMSMAPNSYLTYPISLNGSEYVVGEYTANITVAIKDQQWQWQENFTITQEQAEEFNEQDVSIVQKQGFDWRMVLLLAAVFLLLGGGLYSGARFLKKRSSQKA